MVILNGRFLHGTDQFIDYSLVCSLLGLIIKKVSFHKMCMITELSELVVVS